MKPFAALVLAALLPVQNEALICPFAGKFEVNEHLIIQGFSNSHLPSIYNVMTSHFQVGTREFT